MADTTTKQESDIRVALEAGMVITNIRNIPAVQGSQPILLVPQGYSAKAVTADEVEKWNPAPWRKRGKFEFADVESFVRYFNEHKTPDSRIFAEIQETGATYRGILNFHGETSSWNDHECTVELQPTHEWQVWCAVNKKELSQAAFAAFLEENADMFVEPNGADLLTLVSTLEGRSNVEFSQGIKLQTGAIDLKFTEVVELSGGVTGPKDGKMQVPALLKVSIAPFEGTARYDMQARLRFRINNRKLFFFYEAVEPHLVVRTVCADVSKVIEEQTQQRPFKV